ncbi:MAG: hypothetical protein JRE72_07605 [Deltaproteobacteria bacterium]|nr:hypothetical protein [Deltaproteobacteria bacterium]
MRPHTIVSVREHYENHPAPCYAWICGGAEHNLEENRNFFKVHNIQPLCAGLDELRLSLDAAIQKDYKAMRDSERRSKYRAFRKSHQTATPPKAAAAAGTAGASKIDNFLFPS